MCKWVLKKGKNKGSQCPTKSAGEYCSRHRQLVPPKPFVQEEVDVQVGDNQIEDKQFGEEFVPPFKNGSNDFGTFGTDEFKTIMEKVFKGFHMVSHRDVNADTWENHFFTTAKKVCKTIVWSKGSHKPGVDMELDGYKLSLKSFDVKGNGKTSMSSYRMTNITSESEPGVFSEILKAIKARDSSFNYYVCLFRKKNKKTQEITYYFCVIPKTCPIFNIQENEEPQLIHGLSKKTKKVKLQKWKGSNWEIRFSMSSQLWYMFDFSEIEKYIVHSFTVSCVPCMDFSDIVPIKELKDELKKKDEQHAKVLRENEELKDELKKKDEQHAKEVEELRRLLREATNKPVP